MKTKPIQSAQPFHYRPSAQLAGTLLERVRKNGVAAVAKPNAISQSALRFQQENSYTAKLDYQLQSRVATQTVRTAAQNGAAVATRQISQGEQSQQRRQEVAAESRQVVQGSVNGKAVYSNVERQTLQVSDGRRDASFAETRNTNEITARNVVRSGNATRVTFNVQTASDRNRKESVDAEQRTDTDTRVRTYDALGNLLTDRASHQAVTVRQRQETAVRARAEASRDFRQESAVAERAEGNVSVRQSRAETTDTAKGHQEIETEIQSASATLVENLGVDGAVLSAKASAQQSTTIESRTIDSSRTVHTEQTTDTLSRTGAVAVTSRTRYDSEAATVEHVAIASDTQQFDGDGALVRETASERRVATTTTETRAGDAERRTSTVTENGATSSSARVKAEDSLAATARVITEQNGARTERVVENESRSRLDGELTNRVDPDGRRTIAIDTRQTRETESEDLTVGANGQGRRVETESRLAQSIDGELVYSAAAAQPARSGAGSVVVGVATAGGLAATFKLDAGTLEFDFAVETTTVTRQETVAGKVVETNGQAAVAGSATESGRASAESIHLHGRVTASLDAHGNRVIGLDGEVTRDAAAVVVANGGERIAAERSHTELDFSGRLAVNRQISSDGSATRIQTSATAELDVARVDTSEAAGVNTPALTHLASAEALRAGFQAYRGAIALHLGGFDFNISFLA